MPQIAMKDRPIAAPGQKPKWVNAAVRPALTATMNAISAELQTIIRII
jgi:hypothetical protein